MQIFAEVAERAGEFAIAIVHGLNEFGGRFNISVVRHGFM
jgi:hypothetical protein